MITHSSTYSNKIATFNIINNLQVELEIQHNPYNIPLEELFLMAARINKKRSFLFVSKVLGKHLPIYPKKGILIGALLAARYMEVVKGNSPVDTKNLLSQFKNDRLDMGESLFIRKEQNPIIIGFAETATALGHAFFEAFSNADFFHTTRELLQGETPTITFEEEHSHATSHRAYINPALLDSDREIILVDDEVTTGKTAINIIRSIHEKYPRKEYTVISILDWRSDENVQHFGEVEKELGITIHSVSILKGTVSEKGNADLSEQIGNEAEIAPPFTQKVSFHPIGDPARYKNYPYTHYTGRFGLNSKENVEASRWMEEVGKRMAMLRMGKTLVLGTGEFMYIPMKIASYMGENVFYHSTTRSPIYPNEIENYGAQNRFSFPNPEDEEVQHFLYNIAENQYDDIFLFFEKKVELEQLQPMLKQLEKTKVKEIKILYLSEKEGEG